MSQRKLPRIIQVAGIIWIVLGAFVIAGSLAFVREVLITPSLMELMDTEPPVLGWLCCMFILLMPLPFLMVGVLSLAVGVRTVRGRASDMFPIGIASICLGLYAQAGMLYNGPPSPRTALALLIVGESVVLSCLLAGTLALIGAKRYKAEIENRIQDWLTEHVGANPADINCRDVAEGTGLSLVTVRRSSAWRAYREMRRRFEGLS